MSRKEVRGLGQVGGLGGLGPTPQPGLLAPALSHRGGGARGLGCWWAGLRGQQ